MHNFDCSKQLKWKNHNPIGRDTRFNHEIKVKINSIKATRDSLSNYAEKHSEYIADQTCIKVNQNWI